MNLITLSNQNMPLVEFQGQRVVTFAMVDEAHQRPKGTASAAFRRHRDRFTIGKHYFELDTDAIRGELKVTGYVKRTELSNSVTADAKRTQLGEKITNDVKRRQLLTELFPKHTKSGVVITELGYLLLTKPFTDDLAWQVQEQLVEAYFRPVAAFPDIRPIPVPTLETLEAMSPMEAADLIAQIEHRSHWRHGKHGSAEMTQRKRELKLIRPAIKHVRSLIQMVIPGLEGKS